MTIHDSLAAYIALHTMPRVLRPHMRFELKIPANDNRAPKGAA